jgi:hypothetical protein
LRRWHPTRGCRVGVRGPGGRDWDGRRGHVGVRRRGCLRG